MFAFLGSLFGSAKAGEKIIDGVTSSIDKLWHTDEEKADDVAQARREGMTAYMAWLPGVTCNIGKSQHMARTALKIIAKN